ncbi:unnamed protein product [Heligmosomoides polygyrus]|uniref:NADH dehydrogenase [ubiquinone] 1 alpha subcomplex subunit 1 n=1 Tax=Heligmosomoides polygyrus TaxID=6339 RepID=A0A183G6D5_HELPZ|nr:unnamed protein product [Heligmosomoides polygyrus]
MTRDVTYLIPMLGVPFLIILGMCAYQIKIENDRVKRDKIVEDWISMRKRTARKMPSADLTKSEFKYKGVLKVDGEIGDIKHALDAESSRSLESIKFDPKHNELVVIGSAVEQIEIETMPDEANGYGYESARAVDLRRRWAWRSRLSGSFDIL